MYERTMIQAWFSENGYRSTVVHGHSVGAALAELRRQDAMEPPLPRTYIRVEAEMWVMGEPGTSVFVYLDADGIAKLEAL